MLESAINVSKLRGLSGLTLWASKHYVYSKAGFLINDNSLFSEVTNLSACFVPVTTDEIILEKMENYPPFAMGAYKFYLSGACLTVIEIKEGIAIADFEGENKKLLKIIRSKLPDKFYINSFSDDQILFELKSNGFNVDICPQKLQMWLKFNDFDINNINCRIKVLDRI